MYRQVLLSLFFVTLIGCTPKDVTGPGEVRWDRETCARCSMALSDRNFAAQVRGAPEGQRTALYKFDDIGCAVIWLEKQAWKKQPNTEIWVTDHRSGDWLDATTAFYIKGRLSPMNYGLGAQAEAVEGALDFIQAKAHIMTAETRRHQHNHHQHMDHLS